MLDDELDVLDGAKINIWQDITKMFQQMLRVRGVVRLDAKLAMHMGDRSDLRSRNESAQRIGDRAGHAVPFRRWLSKNVSSSAAICAGLPPHANFQHGRATTTSINEERAFDASANCIGSCSTLRSM